MATDISNLPPSVLPQSGKTLIVPASRWKLNFATETPTMRLRLAVYPKNPHSQILEQLWSIAHADGRHEEIWKPVEIVKVEK